MCLADDGFFQNQEIKTRNDDIVVSFICKSNDKFTTLEDKLEDMHPGCKGKQFRIGNNIIDKEKTLEENKIGQNSIITFENN